MHTLIHTHSRDPCWPTDSTLQLGNVAAGVRWPAPVAAESWDGDQRDRWAAWARGAHPLDQLHQRLGLELLDPGLVHTCTVVHLGLLFRFTHAGCGVFWNDKTQQFTTCPPEHTRGPGWSFPGPLLSGVNRAGPRLVGQWWGTQTGQVCDRRP